MNHILLRMFLVMVIAVSFREGLQAQRTAFLYLQSEEGVPFYLKRNNQIYNSSSSGYLILGKLPENDLLFEIGFPGNSVSEQMFRVPISNGGKGMLVKSFGDKGWGLFDFQDASVIYAMQDETISGTKIEVKNEQPVNDPFANMLSDVTKDTSVKYVGVKPKKVDVIVSLQQDSSLAKATTLDSSAQPLNETGLQDSPATDSSSVIQVVKDSSVVSVDIPAKSVFPKSDISLQSNEIVADGTNVVFVISTQQSAKDTVKGFIPAEVIAADTSVSLTDSISSINIAEKDSTLNADSTSLQLTLSENKLTVVDSSSLIVNSKLTPPDLLNDSSIVVVQPIQDSTLTKSLQTTDSTVNKIENSVLKDSAFVDQQNKVEEVQEKQIQHTDVSGKKDDEKSGSVSVSGGSPGLNTTCKKAATDEDFLKARRKMAQQSKDEEMITEVQKFFKNMCFTTEQIRNLGVLFLSEEGRYRFYDASMKFVLDFHNFHLLENTMLTPYYKKRFQALLPE
jgi:hypothetical protein